MTARSISERPPRTYRSELRRQQAATTRSRIVAAAADLFAAEGYPRTTLAKIAAAAGVSAETVQGQGSKAALLIAAVEYRAFGLIGAQDILDLEVGRALLAIEDVDSAMDYLVRTQTEVHERTARLSLTLFGGASADPELDSYLSGLIASVTRQIERILGVFRDRAWLRVDLPFGELVETCAVLCSVEVYLRITHRNGWSADQYRGWLQRTVTEAILARPQQT